MSYVPHPASRSRILLVMSVSDTTKSLMTPTDAIRSTSLNANGGGIALCGSSLSSLPSPLLCLSISPVVVATVAAAELSFSLFSSSILAFFFVGSSGSFFSPRESSPSNMLSNSSFSSLSVITALLFALALSLLFDDVVEVIVAVVVVDDILPDDVDEESESKFVSLYETREDVANLDPKKHISRSGMTQRVDTGTNSGHHHRGFCCCCCCESGLSLEMLSERTSWPSWWIVRKKTVPSLFVSMILSSASMAKFLGPSRTILSLDLSVVHLRSEASSIPYSFRTRQNLTVWSQ